MQTHEICIYFRDQIILEIISKELYVQGDTIPHVKYSKRDIHSHVISYKILGTFYENNTHVCLIMTLKIDLDLWK